MHPQDDPDLKPEYRPSYPVVIANVSVGDKGVIMDMPHITLGHEAKSLIFIERNVVCCIDYHDVTSYDPLPNDLLIDLAKKVHGRSDEKDGEHRASHTNLHCRDYLPRAPTRYP